jgi:hypothetical protein
MNLSNFANAMCKNTSLEKGLAKNFDSVFCERHSAELAEIGVAHNPMKKGRMTFVMGPF